MPAPHRDDPPGPPPTAPTAPVPQVGASDAVLRAFLDGLDPLDPDAATLRAARLSSGDPSAGDIDALLGVLDLTLLAATATPAAVRALCRRGLRPDPDDASAPPVAAVCVTPDLVATAVAALGDSAVRIASVAGAFPSGRTLRAIKVAEVAAAVEAGADEIDAVLDRAALADDRPGDVVDDVAALRGACGGARLKVILETGALPTLEQVRRACWLALIGGADMVKTSTGTVEPGATPAAVLVLLDVARAFGAATGRQAGVKAAGGVRSPQDAAGYLRLARAVAGRAGTSPERLRIGASSLLDALVVARHTAGTPRDGTAGAGP